MLFNNFSFHFISNFDQHNGCNFLKIQCSVCCKINHVNNFYMFLLWFLCVWGCREQQKSEEKKREKFSASVTFLNFKFLSSNSTPSSSHHKQPPKKLPNNSINFVKFPPRELRASIQHFRMHSYPFEYDIHKQNILPSQAISSTYFPIQMLMLLCMLSIHTICNFISINKQTKLFFPLFGFFQSHKRAESPFFSPNLSAIVVFSSSFLK